MSEINNIVDEFISEYYYELIEKGDSNENFEKLETRLSRSPEIKTRIADILQISNQLRDQVKKVLQDLNDDKEVDLTKISNGVTLAPIPVSQEIPLNIDYIEPSDLDPSVITNRLVADKYVRCVLMQNIESRNVLKKLKLKQKKHEIELFGRRKQILIKIQKEVLEEENSKSQIMKQFNKEKSAKIIQQRLQELYKESDSKALKFFQNLYADYYLQFKKLKIPFFCLRKDLYYNSYKEDRKFIVQLIDDLISDV